MSVEFTDVGEFHHGKGVKKTRLGPQTFLKRGTKQTPNEIAIGKLVSILSKKNALNDNIYEYVNLVRNSDHIRFMNMAVLAEVILFVTRTEDISDMSLEVLSPYIDSLIPRDERVEDLELVKLRMAATFVRYLRYLLTAQSKQS